MNTAVRAGGPASYFAAMVARTHSMALVWNPLWTPTIRQTINGIVRDVLHVAAMD
jgi:hypothetical protein